MLLLKCVVLFVALLCMRLASSFNLMSSFALNHQRSRLQFTELSALKRMKAGSAAPIEEPGKNIPEEIAAQQCIYDMILVERVSMPESTGSTTLLISISLVFTLTWFWFFSFIDAGLFIPRVEGEDRKNVALVLNMPKSYGLESENGRIQSIEVWIVYTSSTLNFRALYTSFLFCVY